MKIKPFETIPRWVRLWTIGVEVEQGALYRPFGACDFVAAIGVPAIYLGVLMGVFQVSGIRFPFFLETLGVLVPAYLVIRIRADAWLRREWRELTGMQWLPRNGREVRRALSPLHERSDLFHRACHIAAWFGQCDWRLRPTDLAARDIRSSDRSWVPLSTIPRWVRSCFSQGAFQQPPATAGTCIVLLLAAFGTGMIMSVSVWAIHLSLPLTDLAWTSYVGCALFVGVHLLTWHAWREKARAWLFDEWRVLTDTSLTAKMSVVEVSPLLLRLSQEDAGTYQRAYDIALHCGLLPQNRSFT